MRHSPAKILKRAHRFQRFTIESRLLNGFTAIQPGTFSQGTGHRTGQDRFGLLKTTPIHHRIEQHGQQQIGQRPGCDHRCTRLQRLGVECQMTLGRIDRRFALVQHLDVAAQGQHANGKFSLFVLEPPGVDGLAKADGKLQHLDATRHGNPIVSVLMHGNQNAQRDEKRNQRQHFKPPDLQPIDLLPGAPRRQAPANLRCRVPHRMKQPPGFHD